MEGRLKRMWRNRPQEHGVDAWWSQMGNRRLLRTYSGKSVLRYSDWSGDCQALNFIPGITSACYHTNVTIRSAQCFRQMSNAKRPRRPNICRGPTSMLKLSPSSDIVSCVQRISGFWCPIGFHDYDSALVWPRYTITSQNDFSPLFQSPIHSVPVPFPHPCCTNTRAYLHASQRICPKSN